MLNPRVTFSAALLLMVCIATASEVPNGESLQSSAGRVIPETLFALNLFNLEWGVTWPNVPFASWHSGKAVWNKLEARPGVFDFTALDQEFASAQKHGVSLLLLLQNPPTWASARPNEFGCCGTNAPLGTRAEPKDLRAWKNY